MHIFTTTQDTWAAEGLRYALLQVQPPAGVKISVIDSAGGLLAQVGNRMPKDAVLLPVFPDNQPVSSLRSLTFLNEWRLLQTGLFHFCAPCILWGDSPLIRNLPAAGCFRVIPWRTPPALLAEQIITGMQHWRHRRSIRRTAPSHPGLRLSPRETEVLRYTLDGRSLDWIAEEIGVSSKTVWTHRRRAMNVLGIRRLYELMTIPSSVLCTR